MGERSLMIDLALKNADSLLQDVMKAVDTNDDGRITYSGMCPSTSLHRA